LKKKTKKKRSHDLLFRRGNITLLRLLMAVNSAGPKGISTMNLFRQLRTTGYGQTTLSRALRDGLIERIEGKSEHGYFAPIMNIITQRGKDLLADALKS
jgi:hypothetical protein